MKYYAQKINKVSVISEDEIQKFHAKGYDILDENGKRIYEAIPNDVNSLKASFANHVNQINELNSVIERLKATIEELNNELATLKAKKAKAATPKKAEAQVEE